MNKNVVEIFNNEEFGQVRTLTIDEKPYVLANDVAKALGYSSPKDAVSRHCKSWKYIYTPTNGGNQKLKFIDEENVILLISSCKNLSVDNKINIIENFKQCGIISNSYIPIISRKEIEFGNKLNEILKIAFDKVKEYINDNDANIVTEVIKQYPVLNYKIDFYLPFFHIGIEYDEDEHKYRTDDDNNRQKEIEKYFEDNDSYINIIRVKEGKENQFIGEFIGNLMNFSL